LEAQAIKDAGFDFVEANIQSLLQGNMDDAQWDAQAPDPAALLLPIEAANCLVPGNMPIIGTQRDFAALTTYMQRVARRAKRMGIQRLVFGSGGARKRPDGVDDLAARQHLEEFTRMAGDCCAEHDVMIVIEHLNKGETNTLNSLADSLELCERLNHPAVQMLVDSYHYGLEEETDNDLLALDSSLMHVHVAEPIDRLQPGGHGETSEKAFDFVHFFHLLRKLGYDQRTSIEAKWQSPVDKIGAQTLAFLREAWAASGRSE
jgi:sugar phosphate isomerase/epimerase